MVGKKWKIAWCVFSLILSLFFSWYRINSLAPGFVERISSYFVYPVLHVQHVLIDQIKMWAQQRKRRANLEQELYTVRNECDALQAEIITLHSLRTYQEDIKELVTFKKRYNDDFVTIAHVLVRTLSQQEHYFLVDAGERDGIKPDMVAVYKNCLVGKVECVYPWYSRVRLITDKLCKVASYCASNNVCGIHEGCNDVSSAFLHYVSHLSAIKNDDLILSTGEGLIFPKGFGLGRIAHHKQGDLYQNIVVKPLVDLREINYCVLLAKGEQ